MKKLFFGLVATALVSVSSFGQSMSESSKRILLSAQMVTLVHTAKAFYVKGQTYDDFVRSMTIPSPTVPSQDEVFRKVYGYVSSNTADCDILKADNSSLGRFAQDLANSPKNQSTPTAAFSEKKKWWMHLINHVLNLAETLLIGPAHETIDLWPDA